jgi:zinc transport system permease protein
MAEHDMFDLLQYGFFQNAIMAALLTSIACGIIGVYVVSKKIVFISGGISHASFGGIGLGYFLGVNPIWGVLPFSIVSAAIMFLVNKKSRASADTAIGILWATGMALGILLIYLTPGYAPDLMTYLFGNILMVPLIDILLMLVLDLVIVLMVSLLYKEFLALSFDEEYANISGVHTDRLYLLLLCLIAITVVITIKAVGIILVIALITLPAAISRMYTSNMKHMMILSIAIGTVFSLFGLWLSYVLDLPSGATIILALTAAYVLSSFTKNYISSGRYRRRNRNPEQSAGNKKPV